MKPNNLFNLLVNDHVQRDYFEDIRNFVSDGVYEDPTNRKVIAGKTEVKGNRGALFLANGDILPFLLKSREIVLDKYLRDPISFGTEGEMKQFLNDYRGDDGAFIYNSVDGQIIQVDSLNNSNGKDIDCSKFVPSDFSKKDSDLVSKFGNRSLVAIKCPIWYTDLDVHSFLVRETAYSELGTGNISEFDNMGLARSFHLEYRPNSHLEEFIDSDKGVVGVYRVYDRKNGVSQNSRDEFLVGRKDLDSIAKNY